MECRLQRPETEEKHFLEELEAEEAAYRERIACCRETYSPWCPNHGEECENAQ